MNTIPDWSDFATVLFWICVVCFSVYGILRVLLFGGSRPTRPDRKRESKRRVEAWMILVGLATPPCLIFCHTLAQGPGHNALPGLGQFLAGIIGFPCIVIFLASLKIFAESRSLDK